MSNKHLNHSNVFNEFREHWYCLAEKKSFNIWVRRKPTWNDNKSKTAEHFPEDLSDRED